MLTVAGYLAVQCPATLAAVPRRQCRAAVDRAADTVLLHAVPGPSGAAALARHARQHPGSATTPSIPVALVSFGESANFPLLVTVAVAVAGVAALIHLMAVSVARRRRESGLLKTLGLVRAQLAAVVLWQAATVAVTGIAAGVPLGLLIGRVTWRIFAANLGVVPDTVFPGWLLAAIAAGFLLVSLAIAVIPARTAAASPTARLLRTE
jgi:predicted lysophospholipase L1 biosynthesis ABC-type transport system permease subunit